MVRITMTGFCGSRIDINQEFAIRANLRITFSNNFRWIGSPASPWWDWPKAPPALPPGIPFVVRCKPPVARCVQPVPCGDRIPASIFGGSFNLVMNFGFRHRSTEVVLCFNLRLNLLAQHDRFVRSVDHNFVFRLAILLDLETS